LLARRLSALSAANKKMNFWEGRDMPIAWGRTRQFGFAIGKITAREGRALMSSQSAVTCEDIVQTTARAVARNAATASSEDGLSHFISSGVSGWSAASRFRDTSAGNASPYVF
jgi:hypothetical protein